MTIPIRWKIYLTHKGVGKKFPQGGGNGKKTKKIENSTIKPLPGGSNGKKDRK